MCNQHFELDLLPFFESESLEDRANRQMKVMDSFSCDGRNPDADLGVRVMVLSLEGEVWAVLEECGGFFLSSRRVAGCECFRWIEEIGGWVCVEM